MDKKYTLGRKRTLGYASGIISESLLYNMYFTYYLVFLTTVAKLNPALAGTVSLISVISDAITDPVIGYLSDRPGADKRRYMSRALFPMVITVLAAFVILPGAADGVKFVYYSVVTVLFWLCYTFYTIPYYAVVAEITQDYDERTRIRGISSLINTGAISLGNILPAVLPAAFVGLGLSLAMGWLPTIAVLALLSLLFGFITVRSLRGAALHRAPTGQNRFDFFRTMLSIWKLRPFKAFTVFVFFYLIASSMIQANIVFTIVNCVGLTQDFMAVIVGILVVAMLVFIPLTTWIAEKRDRRLACLIMFSLMLVGLIAVKIMGITSVPVLIVEAVAMAVGTAAFWTVFYSISYDLVEVDEMTNDTRREGAITAIPQFIQKFGAAIGIWLAGILLALYGFESDIPVQSEATIRGIENIGTIIPAAFLLVSIIGLFAYPVTKARFAKLHAALQKKRKGEAYTTEGFEKLVDGK
jgi:GPH family glycoside/pentoside/hexuronide:cation symporter